MDPNEVVNKIDRCPSEKFLQLNFGCSDYTLYAPGVRPEEMIIRIPESGELPKVAQELDIDQLLVDYPNWVFRDGKTSHNIGVLVLQNLQNFERVDAQKTTVLGLPAVKMSNDEGMSGEEIILPWIEVRNEWVFVYHLFFPEAGGLSDDIYEGSFALDDMCSFKILEAYGLNKNSVDLKSVQKTSPYELEKLVMANGIVIEFKAGSLGRYPGSSGGRVTIPLKGELPNIPSYIKELYDAPENVKINVSKFHGSNKFVESISPYRMVTNEFDLAAKKNKDWQVMQLRWVRERGEWVGIAYKNELFGFDDEEEFYEGPFTLDDYCAGRLKQAYGIPNVGLNTSQVIKASPSSLERLAKDK